MMKKLMFPLCLSAIGLSATAQTCYASLSGDTLVMGNEVVERRWLWRDGGMTTIDFRDKVGGTVLKQQGTAPDFAINVHPAKDGKCEWRWVEATPDREAHLLVTVTYAMGALDVRREYRLYEGCPAVAVDTWLRGSLDGMVHGEADNAADRKNIEHTADMKTQSVTATLDRLNPGGNHWHARAVEFVDVTDWNNNLVTARDFISYRKTRYRGNLLLAGDLLSDAGFFFLKEAPCSNVQLAYGGADFIADFGSFCVTGAGVAAADVKADGWIRAYGCVAGIYTGGEREGLIALHNYQKRARRHNARRDEMVMMNTWGDRSQDAKVNETFCLAELERAARLGITHFQIDDGWQAGKSPNSAVAQGSFKDIWQKTGYWQPDTAKYPRGLTPVVERGRELGIEIGLWFNPSVQDDFADWQKDAETLVGLWRQYGVRVFKIDGLAIPTKRAEENLRSLFDHVLAHTNREVVFNLDVTAGRRGGYNMLCEYGNIFLENRYTDWGNYYPYHTLRNLWQLARYVPAERLQVEFLNPWRNADKYAANDVFAPARYSFDYMFAITLAGQPLAWMEASNLPEEAFGIAPQVKAYRKVMADFHSGTILPVGEEPSGRSWTGFQSIRSDREGYLLLYREDNDRETASVKSWLPANAVLRCSNVMAEGKPFTLTTDAEGRIAVGIPSKNQYLFLKYSLVP